MRKQRNDLGSMVGERFTRLTVASSAGVDKHQKRIWNCLCDCGNQHVVSTTQLRLGKTRSCGCLKTEAHTTHGDHKSLEYCAWRSMRNRCVDPNNKFYPKYGGRGIKVCVRWGAYANFLSDMGRKPTKQHSLERIDNDGDYEPSNCKWATKTEQTRNRSTSNWVEFNGRTQLVGDWAKELDIKYATLYQRLRSGWSVVRAFTTPTRKGL